MKSKKRLRSKKKVKRTKLTRKLRKIKGGTYGFGFTHAKGIGPASQYEVQMNQDLGAENYTFASPENLFFSGENNPPLLTNQPSRILSAQWGESFDEARELTGRLKKKRSEIIDLKEYIRVVDIPLYSELLKKQSPVNAYDFVVRSETERRFKKYAENYSQLAEIARNTEYFSDTFISGMYDNCFCFIDLAILELLFYHIGGGEAQASGIRFVQPGIDVNNDTFAQSGLYTNSIVFKGDPVTGGHYVYVDHDNNIHGTYEELILLEKDDGVCHFYALIMALQYNTGGRFYRPEMSFHQLSIPITFTSIDTLHHLSTVYHKERRNPFLIITNYYLILGFIRYVIVQPVWVEDISNKTGIHRLKIKTHMIY